jgi:CRP-like cAMP-binding protein
MKTNLNSHISIAEQIIDGSITIKSIEEFKSILKIFPNDAALQKAYSNLLQQKNQPDAAVKSYDRAAQLFIEAGKILQAIDSKMLQWKIKPPTPQEAQLFYSALRKGSYYESSLKTFFNRLTYPEMVSFVSKLIRTELSPGKMIKKAGEEEKDLYFVVSGNLKETIFVPLRKGEDSLYRKRASFLSENQFFGDVYPFKEENRSKSYIEASTRVELVRITKSNLIKICEKHPNIEMGLIDLYKVRKQNIDGYSRDVSIGGLCVILDGKYRSISAISKNIKEAKIEMSLPEEELVLKVAGSIVWSREFSWKKKKIVALGFRFKDMSPKFKGMFFMMADSICYDGVKRR